MFGAGADLWVVGAGDVDRSTLDTAADALDDFPLEVRVHDEVGDLTEFVSEAPLHGLDLATAVAEWSGHGSVLVVTDADIHIPDHGWTFGVSGLGGDVAAVSTARLWADDIEAEHEPRLRKEARKHAGHLLGVGECADDDCVFSQADSTWGLDGHDGDPCADCWAQLQGESDDSPAGDDEDDGLDTAGGDEPLWVVGVGSVDRQSLDSVADAARETFGVDARVEPHPVALSEFDGESEPCHGLDLARYAALQSGRSTVLAVTDADIEKPRGDPAFGLAMRGGSEGIVSTARLGEPGDGRFADRLRTVAVQHVGYLAGMGACRSDNDCLFRVADDPTDFDRIGSDACEDCRADLAALDHDLATPDGDGTGEPAPDEPEPSGSESVHDLVGAARFWVAVGLFAASWVLTAGVVGTVVEAVTGSATPESDALLWLMVAVITLVAWKVYKTLRSLLGAAWGAFARRARAVVPGV